MLCPVGRGPHVALLRQACHGEADARGQGAVGRRPRPGIILGPGGRVRLGPLSIHRSRAGKARERVGGKEGGVREWTA